MLFNVIGYKSIVSKKDGVRYVELHLTSHDRGIIGLRCDSFFVRADIIDNIDILSDNCLIEVSFNRYGRPCEINIVI